MKSTVSDVNRVKTMSCGNRISFPCHSETKCLISSFFLSWQEKRNNSSMIRFKCFMIFYRYILNVRIGSLLFTSVARIVPVSLSHLRNTLTHIFYGADVSLGLLDNYFKCDKNRIVTFFYSTVNVAGIYISCNILSLIKYRYREMAYI